MTKAQEKRLNQIKTEVEEMRTSLHRNGEIKKFDVTESEYGTVGVVCVIGGQGDEGTLAECFARDSFQIFIGKRGGVTYYDNKFKSHRLGTGSLLGVCLAQRIPF